MRTIIVTSTNKLWAAAQECGSYTQSTAELTLDEVGYIHATSPDQTIAMLNRRFSDRDDVILLLVDLDKVEPEVKFEASSSGITPGLFPHIYGPLNLDAVYDSATPVKSSLNTFADNTMLAELSS